ncbi:MAG: hypothetical protein Q4B58_02570, partial [Bacteroidales bacterium]|nr:hypothetical protein [Bacteroidales bacterium]
QEANHKQLYVEVKGSQGGELTSSGETFANFDMEAWHNLTALNQGGKLTFTVWAEMQEGWIQYNDFEIYVSPYPLTDYGVTYRKIAPGYETYSHIGNYQRNIHTWDEEAIIESQTVPGQCMSCHTANRANPKQFTFQLRGKHGSTLVQREVEPNDPACNTTANGKPTARQWLVSKTDSTLSKCVYPYWHPSGNFCAYSLNLIHQLFWTGKDRQVEVFDDASDVVVLDVRNLEILRSPLIEHTLDWYETYPAFSEDGKWLYFCRSVAATVPAHCDSCQYNLCRIAFDEETRQFGDNVEVVIDAASRGKNITLPRPSYDGRYIMYCYSDYGNFPIDHKESDLWLLDLATGEERPATEANSEFTESYHNWSSDSHWFLFSSRRDDGLYSLLYIASIDNEGRISKPFVLPQHNPWQFYHQNLYSFNVPDFTSEHVDFDVQDAYNEVFTDKQQKVWTK